MGTSGSQATAQPGTAAAHAPCRFCGAPLSFTFVDLGMSPLCQTHIEPHELNHMERFYPLHARVCGKCYLVQLEEFVSPDAIFSDYAYFSSYSDSWIEHARRYTESMITRLGLGPKSLVMEIASNDGYLLQHFVARGVPCRGIEPAANVAEVAVAKGIPTTVKFFGRKTAAEVAQEHGRPDLLLGNNVLAHVPDINDFVGGMSILLKQGGVLTMEFPHLLKLMDENQFDTIYHEHFSYLSLGVTDRILSAQGLKIFDVEELPTHGGSLRIFAAHADDESKSRSQNVGAVLAAEEKAGLRGREVYENFQPRIDRVRSDFLRFLIDQRDAGKKVAGYGAAAKGNTLLNYCGVKGAELVRFVADASPHKQERYLPGSHIPVVAPQRIDEERPDFIVIFPWNLRDEIAGQLGHAREWGAKFVTAIPELKVW